MSLTAWRHVPAPSTCGTVSQAVDLLDMGGGGGGDRDLPSKDQMTLTGRSLRGGPQLPSPFQGGKGLHTSNTAYVTGGSGQEAQRCCQSHRAPSFPWGPPNNPTGSPVQTPKQTSRQPQAKRGRSSERAVAPPARCLWTTTAGEATTWNCTHAGEDRTRPGSPGRARPCKKTGGGICQEGTAPPQTPRPRRRGRRDRKPKFPPCPGLKL